MAEETIIEGYDGKNGKRSDETEIYDDRALSANRSANRYKLNLPPEKLDFTSKGGTHYVLDCGDVIGSGGEGCVVVAKDDRGNDYAAKVAYIMPQYLADNEDILQRLVERTAADPGSYRRDHLMPTYAWGTVYARPVGHERDTELLVTVMPRCRPLADEALTPAYVKGTVLPHLAEALKTLHDMNIVHRDVKPANVYELEGSVVLGDFGISCPLEEGQNIHDTRTDRRTVGYTPRQNAVMKENDWYSLGYTLWTMYNGGVHPYQPYIDEYFRTGTSDTLARAEQGFRDVRFTPLERGDETFGQLIFGLTALSAPNRLGYDDVRSYLNNPEAFRYEDKGAVLSQARNSYTFDGVECGDDYRLACELASKWNKAKRHLYAGNLEDYYRTNKNFDLAATLNEIVECDPETVTNQDLGLARAIFFISGDHRMLCWKGKDVSLLAMVEDFKTKEVDELEGYDEALANGVPSWSLAQFGDSVSAEASKVMRVIESTVHDNPNFARSLFQQLFAQGGPSEFVGDMSFETLMASLFGSSEFIYTCVGYEEVIDTILAAMAPTALRLGTLDKLVTGRKGITDDSKASIPSRVERLLVLLDAVGKGSSFVRTFAVNYGPKGGWLWSASHTALYECSDSEGRSILEKLAKVVPNASDDVVTIMKNGEEARYLCEKLYAKMDWTPLSAYLGYPSGKSVTTKDADALPCASFYGDAVPRGFARSMLLAADEAERDSWFEVNLLSYESRRTGDAEIAFSNACGRSIEECATAAGAMGSAAGPIARIVIAVVMLVLMTALLFSGELLSTVGSGVSVALALLGLEGIVSAASITSLTLSCAAAFFLVELVISVRALIWSSASNHTVSKCEALRDQGDAEIRTFSSGTSQLAAHIKDMTWSGSIDGVNLLGRIENLANTVVAREGLTRTTWYKAAWQFTSFLPAMVLPLPFLLEFGGEIPNALNSYVSALFDLFDASAPAIDTAPTTLMVIIMIALIAAYIFVTRFLINRFERNGITWIGLVVGTSVAVIAVTAAIALVIGLIGLAAALVWAIIQFVIELIAGAFAVLVAIGILGAMASS